MNDFESIVLVLLVIIVSLVIVIFVATVVGLSLLRKTLIQIYPEAGVVQVHPVMLRKWWTCGKLA